METYNTGNIEKTVRSEKKTAVLHQAGNFKIRIIELPPEGSIPPCEMASSVIFHILAGDVNITSDGDAASIEEGQGVVSGPATISMRSVNGASLLGIQMETEKGGPDE